jgi:hypothetical protein
MEGGRGAERMKFARLGTAHGDVKMAGGFILLLLVVLLPPQQFEQSRGLTKSPHLLLHP